MISLFLALIVLALSAYAEENYSFEKVEELIPLIK
jgi:hypothetical protein